mgnify:CR=1 FL=1
MPPHYLNPPALLHITYRSAKYLLLAGALALTGCATTGTQQSSQDKDRAELDHGYYADYEFQTESDPLGTYLANRARNDINIAYSSDRRQGRTESRSKQNSSSTHGLANAALNFLGVKYSFGGDAPSTGFDCSGLVSYVAEKSLGLKLPRQSKDIAKEGTSVNRSELRKGDLVFFNTMRRPFSHVGIYLGDKRFLHAPAAGKSVHIVDMREPYWALRFDGARRIDL